MSYPSTYMGFPISTIGVDSGLDWETNINAALTAIDSHNHSPGQGQQVQPNGLNISSDLTFQSNNATSLRAARFTPQDSEIPNSGDDVGELYVSGNELYYNDVTGGNQVQLTSNGAVNATSSGISDGTASAAFSAGVLVVKSTSTSGANIKMQSAVLTNSGDLTNTLTLQAPTLSGSITETLPPIPGSTGFMIMATNGNMAATIPVAGGLATSNYADASVTRPKLASVGQQVSSSCGIFTTTSTSFVSVTNLSVTITTSGRPVMLMIQADGTGSSSSFECVSHPGVLAFFRGVSDISGVAIPASQVPGCMSYLDAVAAGTYTYTLQAKVNSGGTLAVSNAVLVAYEL